VDILILLPGCLILSHRFLKQEGQESIILEGRLRDSIHGLVAALDRWRLKYPHAEDAWGPYHLESAAPRTEYSYDSARALVAVFNAANVIARSLLLLVSPSVTHQSHNYRAHLHAQSVLIADAHIDSRCTVVAGGGSSLIAFALKILGAWAPLPQQRDYAIRKLENWDSQPTRRARYGFAAPVLVATSTERAETNVCFVNVAKEILCLRAKSMILQEPTCQ
jgi:hypothetical protein